MSKLVAIIAELTLLSVTECEDCSDIVYRNRGMETMRHKRYGYWLMLKISNMLEILNINQSPQLQVSHRFLVL